MTRGTKTYLLCHYGRTCRGHTKCGRTAIRPWQQLNHILMELFPGFVYNIREFTAMWVRGLNKPIYNRCESIVIWCNRCHSHRYIPVLNGRGVVVIKQDSSESHKVIVVYDLLTPDRHLLWAVFSLGNTGTTERNRITEILRCLISQPMRGLVRFLISKLFLFLPRTFFMGTIKYGAQNTTKVFVPHRVIAHCHCPPDSGVAIQK